MDNCIFCKIIAGEIPSCKIWEDGDYIAILDAFPNIKGQSLVIPKVHTDSDAFKMSVPEYSSFMKAVKKVAKLLAKRLKVNRVHLVLEGTAVNHLHAKLYPAIGCSKDSISTTAKENVKFDSYPGYVTTIMGPRADEEELKELQKRLKEDVKS